MRRGHFALKGWHVGAVLVGFFVLVAGADVTFAVAAYRTFPGEVSAHPYEDGLAYNQELTRRAREVRLGWRAVADARPAASGARVRLDVRGPDGRPLAGLRVTASLSRPATQAGALALALREVGPGAYEATTTAGPGGWDLRFSARNGKGEGLEGERRLQW